MTRPLRPRKLRRLVAFLAAFCCAWMSSAGSLLHTHRIDGAGAPYVSSVLTAAAPFARQHSDICLACEWQANSVEAALPVCTVPRAPHPVERGAVRFLVSPRLLSFRTASRAPPAV